jgi:Ca2+-binding EF-hand superfamily protein
MDQDEDGQVTIEEFISVFIKADEILSKKI